MVPFIWVLERRLAPRVPSPQVSPFLLPPLNQCSAEEY